MKRILSLIVIFLLIASGCTKTPAGVTETTGLQTTPSEAVPTEALQLPVPMDMPLLSLSAPVVSQAYNAADGTPLFIYSYPSVSLTLEDPQIADAVVIDLLNLTDSENSAVQSVLKDAKSAYAKQSDWVPYSYATLFSPQRFDQSILSLYGNQHIRSGSNRSTNATISMTYDLLNGRRLTLTDILKESYSADTLSQLISEALQGLAEKGMLYSDYAYVISELFTTNRPSDSWFFSESGLCFYFAPYEIAPYSAGTVIAEVPYSALTELLREEYFPAEHIPSAGTLHHISFDAADISGFTEFSELILEEQGTKHLIYPDGILQNVRITAGTRQEDGIFQAEVTLFAAAALYSGDALVLQLPQALTYDLQLTYLSEDKTISVDLRSLMDNS